MLNLIQLRALIYKLLPGPLCRYDPDKPVQTATFQNRKAITASEIPSKLIVDMNNAVNGYPNLAIGFVVSQSSPLVNEFLQACDNLGVVGHIFDPGSIDFFDDIYAMGVRILFVRPNYKTDLQRKIFDEKVRVLRDDADLVVLPSEIELRIYEAKRELSLFVENQKIPHPETHLFYKETEALAFLEKATFPLIVKSHRGASSSGVEILHDKSESQSFVRLIFRQRYYSKRVADVRDFEYGYVLFQVYLKCVREFRIIKIGDSWFGHEKVAKSNSPLMSGSGENLWTPPSTELLNFCNRIARKHDFQTMCFDVFQTTEGEFLINELQCWFGSYDPSQMYINGIPGRYIQRDGDWVFDPGYYNVHASMSLRLASGLHLMKSES